jgi:hypothetical protein
MLTQYRVWLTVREAIPVGDTTIETGPRTTFVIYEGSDRRHAKRLARNLASARTANRVPSAAIVESGWEVIG